MTPAPTGLSAETLVALAVFAAASAWSPGPNNFMLAASGATFGMRRTLPHVLGVMFGFPLMLFVLTLGLGEVFRTEPAVRTAISWVGFLVMLYFAFRLARQSGGKANGSARTRPLSFVQAAAFQWVNPKAWAMSIAVAATFASGISPWLDAGVATAVFIVVGGGSAVSWAMAGTGLGRLLGTGIRLRIFNLAMALLLALSAFVLVLGD